MQQVMVINPINPDVKEAQNVAEKYRQQQPKIIRPSPWGTFISSTIIVMMIAITPSLNAANRPVVIFPLFGTLLIIGRCLL
jgi:hypothetical protein